MPNKFAFVFIDFQKDFCSPGGYADSQGGVDWAQDAIYNAKRLLTLARHHGQTIVHTREGYLPDLTDCAPYKLERSKKAGAEIGSKGPLGRFLIRGEPGHDFISELYPQDEELIVDKSSYCAFHGTSLQRFLQANNISHLVFCGVTADVCVHSTLRSAIEHGYRCYYVADAISTFDPEIRRACEKMISVEGGIWGEITSVDSIQTTLLNHDVT